MNKIIETTHKYEARSMHGQLPVVWEHGENDIVWDVNGKKYIDFTSGICVTNVGHGNYAICQTIESNVIFGLLYTYTFYNKQRADFLEYLINHTPKFIEKAFLVSSGTEATEVAVKLMRLCSGKKGIISFKGAMHGRTMLAEQLKGNFDWADSCSSIHYLNFPQKDEKFIPPNLDYLYEPVGGIIIETYQGWSARYYPKKYIQSLVRWCKRNKILVCFDEIQGGMGRTGKLFNYMHYGVTPDLICVGKGFTSSLPMSGVLGRKYILDTPPIGSMSSTHSANPLCCAVGLTNFKEVLKVLPQVKRKGEILHTTLRKIFPNNEINGIGLLAGIIIDTKTANKICYKAMKKGLLLIKTGRESIKIAPPLTIEEDNLIKGLKILKECVK